MRKSPLASATLRRLSHLHGRAYDRAYVANEVAYHKTVNGALESTLIPSAKNGELKSLLAGYDRALAEVARLRSELEQCRAELRHHAGRNYD